MNWQEVLESFKSRITDNSGLSLAAADIALPNSNFEAGARSRWLELSVSPNGYHDLTERLAMYPAQANLVVAVPAGTGGERLNETARRLMTLFSPKNPGKSGWNVNESVLVNIRKVEQMPPSLDGNVCRTNVRVTINVYEEINLEE
ncbi:MAG: hypothetical protein Q4G68_13280 [Planctomycetia bacterium]|nr:hypothetical protein [Planctomycetia bacterium]